MGQSPHRHRAPHCRCCSRRRHLTRLACVLTQQRDCIARTRHLGLTRSTVFAAQDSLAEVHQGAHVGTQVARQRAPLQKDAQQQCQPTGGDHAGHCQQTTHPAGIGVSAIADLPDAVRHFHGTLGQRTVLPTRPLRQDIATVTTLHQLQPPLECRRLLEQAHQKTHVPGSEQDTGIATRHIHRQCHCEVRCTAFYLVNFGSRRPATVDGTPQQIQAGIAQRRGAGGIRLAGVTRQQAHLQQAGDTLLYHSFFRLYRRRIPATQRCGGTTFAQHKGKQVTARSDRSRKSCGYGLGDALRSGPRTPACTALDGLLRKQGHHHHQCNTHQQRRQQIDDEGTSALSSTRLRRRLVHVSIYQAHVAVSRPVNDPSIDVTGTTRRALMPSGMPETTGPTIALIEFLHLFENRAHHRDQDQLCDAFADLDPKRGMPAIPAGHVKLTLIIRVDQADQIAQHDTVLMPQSRTRQDDSCQRRIRNVDGDPGGDQLRLTGPQFQRTVQHRPQVHSGRPVGGVVRQREAVAQAGIKYFQLQSVHQNGPRSN